MTISRFLRLSVPGLAATLLCMALAACASIGTPGGGPRDETPPKLIKASPAPGALNVNRRTIQLEFDEIVTVKDAFSTVSVSPTSASTPRVSALGHKVTVAFQDSLLPDATYTIDFANSIRDNNEGNPLRNFSYTFSTGNSIDTLRISGMVLGAKDLEPQQNMIVGIHTSEADSAFTSIPFERITRTDDRGRFTLRGLKPGNYRLFALGDINNDLRWDNPAEDVAFLDFTISPTASPAERTDTIFNPITGLPDSTFSIRTVEYLPNDILLQAFNVNYKPQYLVNSERLDSTALRLIFNAPSATLPNITLPDIPDKSSHWHLLQRSATNDTLTYWLLDPSLIQTDTIRLAVSYMHNKSRGVWEAASDTVSLITKKSRQATKKKTDAKSAESDATTWLGITTPGSGTQDVNKPKAIEFATPVMAIPPEALRLELLRDTIWMPVDKQLIPDSLNPKRFTYDAPWEFDTQYRLTADSLAITDIFGNSNKPFTTTFRTHKESDYRLVQLNITGISDSIPSFVEILGAGDKVIDRAEVTHGMVTFPYLARGVYYARLIADANGNGIWDTGDYDLRLQPEQVSYLPQPINLKGSMDRYLDWDINILPVDRQKPDAIKKNKPETTSRTNSKKSTATEEDDDE